MESETRAVRKGELAQVFDLLAVAFPEAPRAMFVAQTERDSTFRLRHGRVAVDARGRVVGYVRIFSRTMFVRGVPVAAGGIGSVATAPDARGAGIATALLRDAIEGMRREGMVLSFLSTGIPSFYERLGYAVARQPYFEADAREVIAVNRGSSPYDTRVLELSKDTPQLLAIHQGAVGKATGTIQHTKRAWLDSQAWLQEDGKSFIASKDGRPVAYLRSRCRTYGHQILEAERRPGHERAIGELLGAMARRGCDCGHAIVALAPHAHPLSEALRALPSTVETTDVRFPMMVRVIAPEVLRAALGAAYSDDVGVLFDTKVMRFWNSTRI